MQNKRIAVTGGIGSGKSSVCRILKEKGYPVFSCDEISRKLRREEGYLSQMKELFPDCVAKDGSLREAALSQKVFSDKTALKKLNAAAHPLIMNRLTAEMAKYPVSFAEVPLLFEGGFESCFDEVIAVVRDKTQRILSVMKRSGLSEEEVIARMNHQFEYERLPEKKCYVIGNDGSFSDLKRSTEELLFRLDL